MVSSENSMSSIHIDGKSQLFPIIGDPIVYVRSPERLSEGLSARGYNGICIPMHVAAEALPAVMAGLDVVPNIRGLLVTMPHKFTAFEYCTTASETASLFKVVSVMRRNDDGSWHGDMLDGLAFVKAQRDGGAQFSGKNALLIGAGGAGSAIALAAVRAGVAKLTIHDVDDARAKLLADLLSGYADARVEAGPANPAGYDLMFNATPLGMEAGDPPPIDPSLLNASMFVGDVIAGHGETPFLKAARDQGCKTVGGDQMVEAVQEMMLDFMMGA
jgi:shikimate dehydrogenase